MKINVWASCKGVGESLQGCEFPYIGISPLTRQATRFETKAEIIDELVKCNELYPGTIWELLHIFASPAAFIEEKYQDLIKMYRYCKAVSCPPYASINDTPANIMDAFLIIEQEVNEWRQHANTSTT